MPISLAPRLDLRPTQTLIMTPQLMQAIKLLQLTNLELSAVIDKEIEENPLLERTETDDDDGPDLARAEASRADRDAASRSDDTDDIAPSDRFDASDHSDIDAPPSALDPDAPAVADASPDAYATDPWRSVGAGGSRPDEPFEPTDGSTATLRDHLIEQVTLGFEPGTARVVALYLVDCLDPAGYLRDDAADLCRRLGIGAALLLPPAALSRVVGMRMVPTTLAAGGGAGRLLRAWRGGGTGSASSWAPSSSDGSSVVDAGAGAAPPTLCSRRRGAASTCRSSSPPSSPSGGSLRCRFDWRRERSSAPPSPRQEGRSPSLLASSSSSSS